MAWTDIETVVIGSNNIVHQRGGETDTSNDAHRLVVDGEEFDAVGVMLVATGTAGAKTVGAVTEEFNAEYGTDLATVWKFEVT